MGTNIPAATQEEGRARVFFALWPAPELRRRLHALAVHSGEQHGGRVMRTDTLHLTLLFMGEVARLDLPRLCGAVDALDIARFSIQLEQMACWRHNRIAYAAPVAEVPALHALAARLREAAESVDISFDTRAFAPHVTLLRSLEQPFEPQTVALPAWRVEQYALVESAPAGGYRTLQVWRCV